MNPLLYESEAPSGCFSVRIRDVASNLLGKQNRCFDVAYWRERWNLAHVLADLEQASLQDLICVN